MRENEIKVFYYMIALGQESERVMRVYILSKSSARIETSLYTAAHLPCTTSHAIMNERQRDK
jgi:hypothetical protein